MLQLHIQIPKSFLDKSALPSVASGSSFSMLIHEVTQRMLQALGSSHALGRAPDC